MIKLRDRRVIHSNPGMTDDEYCVVLPRCSICTIGLSEPSTFDVQFAANPISFLPCAFIELVFLLYLFFDRRSSVPYQMVNSIYE